MPNVDRIESLINVPVIKQEVTDILARLGDVKKFIEDVGRLESLAKGAGKFSELAKATDQLNAALKTNEALTKQLADAQEKMNRMMGEVNAEAGKGSQAFGKMSASLQENIAKQVEFKNRLAEISTSMKDLKKQQDLLSKIEGNDAAKKEIKDRIQAYAEEQAQIKVLNSELGRMINIQVKEGESVENSIKAAQGAVARLTIERNNLNISTEEGKKKTDEINAAIDKNNEFIKDNVDLLGKQKINIGNYQGSAKIIVDALKDVEKEISNLQQKQQGLQSLSKTNPIGFKLSGGADELNRVNAQLGFVTKQAQALNGVTSNPQFLNIASKVGDTNKELRFFQQQLNSLEDAGLKNSQVYQDVQTRLAKLTDQIGDTRAEIKALSSDSRGVNLFAGSVAFAADVFQTAAGTAALFGASEERVAVITKNLIAIQAVSNGAKGIANELTTKGTAANKAFVFVQGLVATSLDKTATAGKRATAALGLIGIAATIIGGIIIAMSLLNKKLDESTRQSKLLRDVNQEIAKNAGQEIANLQILYKVATNTTLSIRERKKAVDELQEQYPEHFRNIKDEIILQGKAASAYEATKAAILETAKTRAIETKLSEIATNELELNYKKQGLLEDQKLNAEKKRIADRRDNRSKEERGLDQFSSIAEGTEIVSELDRINKRIEENQKDRDFLLNQVTTPTKKIEKEEEKKGKSAEELAREAKERADRELQVQFEIRKVQLQQLADFNKEIADNEKETDLARLFALNQYVLARKEIIDRQAEVEVKIGTKTASEIKLIEEKRIDEVVRLGHEGEEVRLKIVQSEIQERSKMTDEEKKILAKKAEEITKDFDENEKKKREAAKKTLEEKKRIAEEEKELQKKLYEELTTTLTVFFTAGLERRKNDIQDQIDALDTQAAKEIEVVNQSVTSAKDKADQITAIEKTAAAKKLQLEKEQRKIQVEQAKFQKAAQIVKIIGDTAAAIMATLAKTPPPAGLPLALLTGAIGAAQLAAVIAQPIPKYATGTGDKDHPGGLAIVGDGGKTEGVKLPDGTILKTRSTATLVDLPKGSQVFPDFSKMVLSASLKEIPDVKVSVPYDKTERAVKQLSKDLIKTIKDKQETHWHMPGRYETYMRDGSRFRAYLNKNL
jgi:hypothetical protein